MKQSFCGQRLRKLAAVFVVFPVLGCRMFHFENRLNQEAFRIAVIFPKCQHLTEDAAPRLPFDMYDKIDCFSDLCFGVEKVVCAWLRMTRLAKRRRAFSAE